MSEHAINSAFSEVLKNVKEVADANTIIGEAIDVGDGTKIIPVSKVMFGFASGGTDFDSKRNKGQAHFGGGSGSGVTVQPVCFLVVKNGNVSVMDIAQNITAVERTISAVPDVISKVVDMFSKKDKSGNNEELEVTENTEE